MKICKELLVQCVFSHGGINSWLASFVEIDARIALFVQFCFNRGTPLSIPKNAALATLDEVPSITGHMYKSWKALKSWRLKTLVRHRLPLPYELLCSIIVTSFCNALGQFAEGRKWVPVLA